MQFLYATPIFMLRAIILTFYIYIITMKKKKGLGNRGNSYGEGLD